MKENIIKLYAEKIEQNLRMILPAEDSEPATLHAAMRYSVFAGGKRLRPLIVMAVGDIVCVPHEKLMPVACGLELIHNFSLVHDDLPSMDNDDYRRGKLTCHKKFGEGVAVLAGDALLTLAFESIAEAGNCLLVRDIARSSGSLGMAGGQAIDIFFQGRKISNDVKRDINEKKTGRLFQICFEAPLYFIDVPQKQAERIISVARGFGEAFQWRDDIEDGEGDVNYMKEQVRAIYGDIRAKISAMENSFLLAEITDSMFAKI